MFHPDDRQLVGLRGLLIVVMVLAVPILLKNACSSRLASLERKVREWERLTPADKELKNKIDIEAYLPHVESSFQLNARSSVGASGMSQFMPSTGRQYMTVNSSVDQRLDPVVAADAVARYLKSCYSSLHSWPLALTSYNHGLGGMKKAQARYGNDMARIAADYDGRHFRVPHSVLIDRNYAWLGPVRNGSRAVPAGTTIWLPQGVAQLASGQPRSSAF